MITPTTDLRRVAFLTSMEGENMKEERIWKNGVLTVREYTADELAQIEADARRARLGEASRPLSAFEVLGMLIPQQINTLAVDDNTALRMKDFYPEWAADTAYSVGFKVRKDGKLWRVIQGHTSQTGWEPENAASLFEQINETHAGTLDDPIPYSGNMALTNGLYYMQNWVIYLCTRDTVNPVYNPLADLVGLYVEKA